MSQETGVNGTTSSIIKDFKTLVPATQELILAAVEVRKLAYCPYSKFQVGAAIRTTSGKIYTGCNVENGAYGPTICAERNAIAKAVSEGHQSFAEIAVAAYQEHDFTSPCDKSIQELVDAAVQVRKRAYCPYSNFAVGAALRTTSGEIYTGCNVENGSIGLSLCAERVAIAKAVSEGHRAFSEIAIVAYQETSFTSPCGMCRQALSEFTPVDMPVYLAKPSPARVLCTSVCELLPHRFIPDFKMTDNLNFKDL